MSDPSSNATDPSASWRSRGRGRGRSRGGLGKYLRARGRGHYQGRPAVFKERLTLEGEGDQEEDEEEAAERIAKYSRRQLGTNADRYVEPGPELDSDGEPFVEPEVDLSHFLEKQKLSEEGPTELVPPEHIDDEDDVDTSLAHLPARNTMPRKGKIRSMEWDDGLEEMARAKASAEATRDLKSRFKSTSEKLRNPNSTSRRRQKLDQSPLQPPPLPPPDGESAPPPKTKREEMQDFLDDLLG